MELQLRTREGPRRVSLAKDAKLKDLWMQIETICKIPIQHQQIKGGFPPSVVSGTEEAELTQLGIHNGDALIVDREENANTSYVAPKEIPTTTTSEEDDQELAAAIALSMQEVTPSSTTTTKSNEENHLQQEKKQRQNPPPPPSSSSASSSRTSSSSSNRKVERIIIPSNNSCLFVAISRVLDPPYARVTGSANELRELIAGTVLSDPDTYSEVFLGMTTEKYVEWILNPEHWGGGIELSILSEHYKAEIASFDVQSKRCDLFGQEKHHERRVFLLYDGIHYDSLVEKSSEDGERTVFRPDDEEIQQAMAALVESVNKQRQFTDTANFDLRCLVCSQGLVGQAGAVRHAKETGHQNFAEYH